MTSSIRVGRRSIEITNPTKPMFPDPGITKRDLVDYYLAVSDAMLPLVKGRLITMERFPGGIDSGRFFQKGISDYFPDWIDRETVPKKGGTVTHVVVNERATLAYLGNQAAITLHVSLAKQGSLGAPDQMIFDLDPSIDNFGQVRRTALEFKHLLEEIGLYSVVKTTGSRGLHVTVPLDESTPYEDVHTFSRDVATLMASEDPKRLTIETRKEKRGDRIYLDWMRNSPAATAVAPYSPRAEAHAPVAMPIPWSEVEDRKLKPQRYRMKDAARAVERGDDPWKGWRRHARSLKQPRKKLDRLL